LDSWALVCKGYSQTFTLILANFFTLYYGLFIAAIINTTQAAMKESLKNPVQAWIFTGLHSSPLKQRQ